MQDSSGAARFGVVLMLLLATFIVLAAAPGGPWATVFSTALQATTLLAALHAAGSGRLLVRAAIVVAVISLVGAVVESLVGSAGDQGQYFLIDVMLVAAAPAALDVFSSQAFFAQTAHATTSDFVYFSFVTLTTTGYGDLTAALGPGRAAAALEALFGQLYLVTVAALLVGNLGPGRSD